MDQPYRRIARFGRIDGMTAGDKPAALHKVIAFFQLGNKFRNILDGIFIVAVNGQHALIAKGQGKMQAHAQLGTLFAGAGFDQQSVHPVQLQRIGVHAAIGGAAVADDNIHQTVHPGFLGAAQLGQNAGALIDDGDQQAVIAAFGQKGGTGIIRHAGNILDRHWLQAHANTSAI